MFTITADGVPIAYTVLGDGSPLVLLHGFTETADSWREAGYVDRFLRAGRQVVLIDCRGHGHSGKPREAASYTGERRAQDVIAVLDAIGIQAADVVGYSMGGLIALAVAVRFAERVRALVVIGAHPFAQSMAPYRSAVADGLARWLIMIESQGVRLSDEARRRILANDLPALQACVARDRPDWSAALKAFETPLLAIAGSEDPICSAVQAMAEQVGGVFVALAGRNHVTAFLASNEIVSAIEQFLGADAKAVSRTSILAQ